MLIYLKFFVAFPLNATLTAFSFNDSSDKVLVELAIVIPM